MNDSQDNPYAPASIETDATAGAPESKLLKDFRSQILALGVLWIIFGVLAFGLAALIFSTATNPATAVPNADSIRLITTIVVGIIALGWLVSGVLSVMRNTAGVYIGLVLSYIALIGNAVQLRVCGIVFLVVIIIQAHRVIGFAKQLRR